MADIRFVLPGSDTITLDGRTVDKLIRAGEVSARELTELYLARIDRLGGERRGLGTGAGQHMRQPRMQREFGRAPPVVGESVVCIRRQWAHPLICETRILTSSTSLWSMPALRSPSWMVASTARTAS